METAKEDSNVPTVWVYVNTAAPVGDKDHLRIFANVDIAQRWIEEHDPEGVAFEYPLITAN